MSRVPQAAVSAPLGGQQGGGDGRETLCRPPTPAGAKGLVKAYLALKRNRKSSILCCSDEISLNAERQQ